MRAQPVPVLATPAPNFNSLATIYRWMEWLSFGPWLGWCRSAFLNRVRDRRRALILGDGDGRFTARLLRQNPDIQIDAIDASPAMLRALIRRAGRERLRLRTETSDARLWHPSAQARYDLVVTHFFLDCLTTDECAALAAKLRPVAEDHALWIVSEFSVPPAGPQKIFAQAIVDALYQAFAWMTGLTLRRLPGYESALRAAGFSLAKRRDWMTGLLTSQQFKAEPSDNLD